PASAVCRRCFEPGKPGGRRMRRALGFPFSEGLAHRPLYSSRYVNEVETSPGITDSAGTPLCTRVGYRASSGIGGGRRHLVEQLEERVDPGVDVSGGAGLLGPRPEELVGDVEGDQAQAPRGIRDGGASDFPELPLDVGDQLPDVVRRRQTG